MFKEKKFYLTKEGLEKIKKEHSDLKNLWFSKSKGDISKNFQPEDLTPEYLSFQEDLNSLEAKVIELDHILKNVKLISCPLKKRQNIVDLGAKVLIENNGQVNEFEIVGTLEANPIIGKISNESPVGRALLGRKVGDEVSISSPAKTIYKIKKINYQIS